MVYRVRFAIGCQNKTNKSNINFNSIVETSLFVSNSLFVPCVCDSYSHIESLSSLSRPIAVCMQDKSLYILFIVWPI